MARYPKADWRPLAADPSHQALMDAHDGIVLHTMVGTLDGTDSMFHQDGYTGTESHFGVGPDGTVYQWTDTARTADAQLDGTHRLLSIETADMGGPFPPWTGSNVPAWTEKQLDAIAGIVAWAAKEHSFPLTPMANSKPGQRGVGWHRLGIDSSPAFQPGYRVAGGEHWSTSLGKACPGDRRIAQVPEVIRRAKQLLIEGDDMNGNDPLYPVAHPTGPTILAALQEAYEAKETLKELDTKIDDKTANVQDNINAGQAKNKERFDAIDKTLGELVDALKP